MKNKVLIVGGGLSGVVLAYHLVQRGINITLIDDQNNQSSVVAAGMINPLVFRRMTKSWRVDEFIPYCEEFYASIEKQAQNQFFHPIIIRRFFSSIQERKSWELKQYLPDFITYMDPLTTDDLSFNDNETVNEFGSGRVKKSSWIDTTVFMEGIRSVLSKSATIQNEIFNYENYNPQFLSYKNEAYSEVIFCEGYRSLHNPIFSYLPIQPTKGELLEVHFPDLDTTESYNRKCFVLPIGQKQFKIGATYKWHNTDPEPETDAVEDLSNKIKYITNKEYTITMLIGGIRPTTLDRRPIVGEHPKLKGNYFFNGLGAKGYMIAPLLAKEFCEHLIDKIPLNNEIDIHRFDKLLSLTS